MSNRHIIRCLSVFTMVGFACTAFGQGADLTVVIMDSADPVKPNSTVSYEVSVENLGPDNTIYPIILDITLPMDVPMSFEEFLALDQDARTVVADEILAGMHFDEGIWQQDVSGIYVGDSFNNGCTGLMIQPQDLVVPAGTNGSIYFDATLPAVGGVAGVAYTKADGTFVPVEYEVGGCNSSHFDNCGNGDPELGVPCMGPPLTWHRASAAPITLVNSEPGPDNGGPTMGCGALIDFPVGHIALIERGSCSFYIKGDEATKAGASGVIVANTPGYGVSTPTDDSIITMGCSNAVCHSLIITIPSAFISANSGIALKAALDEGEVSGLMGVRDAEPEYRRMIAKVWESASTPTDTNPDNDRYIETTDLSIEIFTDGFESGDPSRWSSVAGMVR